MSKQIVVAVAIVTNKRLVQNMMVIDREKLPKEELIESMAHEAARNVLNDAVPDEGIANSGFIAAYEEDIELAKAAHETFKSLFGIVPA